MTNRLKNTCRVLTAMLTVVLALHGSPAVAQNKVIRLEFSPAIDDYSSVIHDDIQELYDNGGGTLEIAYGIYPFKNAMGFDQRDKAVNIAIRGIKNAAGERPVLKCVAEPGKTHAMLSFITGYIEDRLSVSLSSLEIQGNNVPVNRAATNVEGDKGVEPVIDSPAGQKWMTNLPEGKSYGHPFLFHEMYNHAVYAANVKNFQADDLVIREVYGNGFLIASAGGLPMEKASITNTKIINTWQWQDGFMTGDGIYFGFVKNPRVENCVIYNDIPYTRWIGRIGITLEYNCQDAVIRNNIIGGYNSDIHIENTLGGHLIANNKLLSAVTSITLNEPAPLETDPTYAEQMAKVKPVVIKDNVMDYGFERVKYKTSGYGGRRALIDFTLQSPKLNNSEISGNTMTFRKQVGDDTPITTANFITDIFPVKSLIVKNNELIGVDGEGNETTVDGGTSAVWPPVK